MYIPSDYQFMLDLISSVSLSTSSLTKIIMKKKYFSMALSKIKSQNIITFLIKISIHFNIIKNPICIQITILIY